MMHLIHKDREVEVEVVGYGSSARIRDGYYTDTGEVLKKSEISEIELESGDKIAEAQEARS